MPARELRGTPVGWRDGTRDGRPLRWPCCASRTLATVSAPRSTLPTIHTSRLALPGPIRSSAARRSYALTIPALFYVRVRTAESLLQQLSGPASQSKSGARSDVRCGAACVAQYDRLPG